MFVPSLFRKVFIGGLILIPLLSSRAVADTVDWGWVHSATMRGIHRLYNLEVDEAMAVFDSVARHVPEDPRGHFFQCLVHYYLYGLSREEKHLEVFLEKSEEVIELCERLLSRDKNDARVKFFLGGTYGYRGLAYQANGSILKAATNGRKGYFLLEEAVRHDPTLYDAQMGFGLFRYLVAKVPRSMSWVLTILGFEGDINGGLAMLQRAAEKGLYTRAEAKLYLAQFLFSEGKRDSAINYLNELRTQYPENTLFTVLYAFWQHRQNNLDEALKAAHAAEELNARKKIRYGEELAYSTLGSIYFTLNDFASSSKYFKRYMQSTKNDQRSPNRTIFRAGLAAELAGDRPTALLYYKRVKDIDDRDRAWETFFYNRAVELTTRPLSEAEGSVVRGDNALSRGQHANAVELYRQALAAPPDDTDARLKALYGIMQANYEMKNYEAVVADAEHVRVLEPKSERWVVPHALFKAGQALVRLQRQSEAKEHFEQVRAFKNYDFQDRLQSRVEEELRTVQ